MNSDESKFEPEPTPRIENIPEDKPPWMVSRIGGPLCNNPDCNLSFHGVMVEAMSREGYMIQLLLDPEDIDMIVECGRRHGYVPEESAREWLAGIHSFRAPEQ